MFLLMLTGLKMVMPVLQDGPLGNAAVADGRLESPAAAGASGTRRSQRRQRTGEKHHGLERHDLCSLLAAVRRQRRLILSPASENMHNASIGSALRFMNRAMMMGRRIAPNAPKRTDSRAMPALRSVHAHDPNLGRQPRPADAGRHLGDHRAVRRGLPVGAVAGPQHGAGDRGPGLLAGLAHRRGPGADGLSGCPGLGHHLHLHVPAWRLPAYRRQHALSLDLREQCRGRDGPCPLHRASIWSAAWPRR